MSVRIILPTPLRPYAGKRESILLEARTVSEALSALTGEYADLRRHLFADDGRLRSFVNIYVNDEDIRYFAKEQTPLRDGDTISIVPSIAGGCNAGRNLSRRSREAGDVSGCHPEGRRDGPRDLHFAVGFGATGSGSVRL